MLKRIFGPLIILIVLFSLGYVYYLGDSMYSRYNETVEWNDSSLLNDLHKVPPALAKNYITSEEKKLFQVLADVNAALKEMESTGEIGSKEEKYWELHDKAKAEIEKNDMYESLAVKDVFDEFSLYLNINLEIGLAYETMNIEELDNYSGILASRLSKEYNELENNFLIQLKTIADDYSKLNEFSKRAISELGLIESNILKVNSKVNKGITDKLLREVNEGNLTRFAHIKNLAEMLKSKKWSNLLINNDESVEYYSWKESQVILESLLYTDYVSVSSFKNVQDVMSYDSWIGLEDRDGYIINHEESVVKGVYYNGEELSDDLYVKRGAKLSFVIDYMYIEIEPEPEPEPVVDDEPEIDDGDNVIDGDNDNNITDDDGWIEIPKPKPEPEEEPDLDEPGLDQPDLDDEIIDDELE